MGHQGPEIQRPSLGRKTDYTYPNIPFLRFVIKSQQEASSQLVGMGNSLSHMKYLLPLMIIWGFTLTSIKGATNFVQTLVHHRDWQFFLIPWYLPRDHLLWCAYLLAFSRNSVMLIIHFGGKFQHEGISLATTLSSLLLLLLSLAIVLDPPNYGLYQPPYFYPDPLLGHLTLQILWFPLNYGYFRLPYFFSILGHLMWIILQCFYILFILIRKVFIFLGDPKRFFLVNLYLLPIFLFYIIKNKLFLIYIFHF